MALHLQSRLFRRSELSLAPLASRQDARALRFDSGGVAALNHRLMAVIPAGIKSRQPMAADRPPHVHATCPTPDGFWDQFFEATTATATQPRRWLRGVDCAKTQVFASRATVVITKTEKNLKTCAPVHNL